MFIGCLKVFRLIIIDGNYSSNNVKFFFYFIIDEIERLFFVIQIFIKQKKKFTYYTNTF